MLKKIFILTLVFAFSLTSIFAQESNTNSESESNGNKPREELSKNFIDALASQDENLLVEAIESGSPRVKALAFEALAKKGSSSEALVNSNAEISLFLIALLCSTALFFNISNIT